jgi:hypothetical protein
VEALEKQMAGLRTLRSLVSEVQASVDTLASSQSNLRGEVAQHCSHTSSLLTHLQVWFQLPTDVAALICSNKVDCLVTVTWPSLAELSCRRHFAWDGIYWQAGAR